MHRDLVKLRYRVPAGMPGKSSRSRIPGHSTLLLSYLLRRVLPHRLHLVGIVMDDACSSFARLRFAMSVLS